MTPEKKGEATPNKNTEQRLNPLPFDEAALTEALKVHLNPATEAVEAPEEQPPTEEEPAAPEPEATEEQPGEEVATLPEGEQPEAEEEQEVETTTDSAGVQKRINKLVAQKKEAQEQADALTREVDALKGKLQELESTPPSTIGATANPLGDIWDENKLREKWEQGRTLKRWCEDNADGCEFGGREYTAEEIKAIKRNVEDALELQIPQRAAFLTQYRQVRPVAEQLYPWWKDRNTREYGEAQVVLKQMPHLAALPDYQVLIGDFLAGRALRLAIGKKTTVKPATMPPKAPKQPTAPASGTRVDEGAAEFDARKKRFLQSGSVAELAQLIKGRI